MAPVFQASGLASGMDTLSIVDALADAQRAPIRQLEKRKEAYNIQLSAMGELRSAVEGLRTAAKSLHEGGVVGTTVATTGTGFSATSGTDAVAGSYGIRVETLATAPKWRTGTQFLGPLDEVKAGTLRIRIDGTDHDIDVPQGATLQDVADAINQSDAAVDAAVIDTGQGAFLSVVGKNTGYPVSGSAGDALTVTWTQTGTEGKTLDDGPNGTNAETPAYAAVATAATNAKFQIDGVDFFRRSNQVSDAIPGVSLTLNKETSGPETLLLNRSSSATKENLQKFVDAYNKVNGLLQGELNIGANWDRSRGLSGDPNIKTLQRRMREFITQEVPGLGTAVRTLADIGFKTERDGSMAIDMPTLERALSKNADAVNGLFTASDGLFDDIDALVEQQVKANDGNFDVRKKSIEKAIRQIEDQVLNKEAQIEKFKENLQMRFTSMEQSVGASKNMGEYLKNVKFPGFSKGS